MSRKDELIEDIRQINVEINDLREELHVLERELNSLEEDEW
ncbi:hypothetical protein [Bacillus subtilis]|nr:hypothetical protein [Bacillus subtilis]